MIRRVIPPRLNTLLTEQPPVVIVAAAAAGYAVFAVILARLAQLAGTTLAAAEIIFGLLGLVLAAVLMTYARSAKHPKRWLWFVIGFSLLYQVVRWYTQGARLLDRTGDDDEIYLLLAQQLAGIVDGAPLFTFRSPGLPLLLAGTLNVVGGYDLWAFGLLQRLMLAAVPILLFLILSDHLPVPVAAFAALMFSVTEINEQYPARILVEVSYTLCTVVALYAAFRLIASSDRQRC